MGRPLPEAHHRPSSGAGRRLQAVADPHHLQEGAPLPREDRLGQCHLGTRHRRGILPGDRPRPDMTYHQGAQDTTTTGVRRPPVGTPAAPRRPATRAAVRWDAAPPHRSAAAPGTGRDIPRHRAAPALEDTGITRTLDEDTSRGHVRMGRPTRPEAAAADTRTGGTGAGHPGHPRLTDREQLVQRWLPSHGYLS